MAYTLDPNRQRTDEQIRQHYLLEKGLAVELLQAGPEQRKALYSQLYERLYQGVPTHPMLTAKQTPEERGREIQSNLRVIDSFLTQNHVFMEVGAGDCLLSFEVANRVKEVVAIDVSETISQSDSVPKNFSLVLTDGTSIPLPENSVDVAYSNQLMEHLHPEDAVSQLKNIYKALGCGGIYLCLTPSRLNGPHDVSKYFDHEASGFHLKEYTYSEIRQLFREAGFSRDFAIVGAKGKYFRWPTAIPIAVEKLLLLLPGGLRRKLAASSPFRALLNIRIAGVKT